MIVLTIVAFAWMRWSHDWARDPVRHRRQCKEAARLSGIDRPDARMMKTFIIARRLRTASPR